MDEQRYLVRDREGGVFGPADEPMLRAWVQEGRIVPGMAIGPRETREWVEASLHPAVADLLREKAADTGMALDQTAPAMVEATVTRVDVEVEPAGAPVGNMFALMAFFFGAATWFGSCLSLLPWINHFTLPVAGFAALFAIILGAIGLWQINANPGYYRGRVPAVLGMIMGALGLLALCGIAIVHLVWQHFFM